MIQQASLFGFPVSIIIAAFYLFLKWEWSWGWVVDIMLLKSRQWLSQRTCFFFASPSPNHCVRILSHCWQNSSEKNQLVSYFPIVHDKQGSILKACPSAYYNIVFFFFDKMWILYQKGTRVSFTRAFSKKLHMAQKKKKKIMMELEQTMN